MKKKDSSGPTGSSQTGAEKTKQKSSLRTLALFCLIVGGILAVSLCYRSFILVKNSRFDGKSGFIVATLQEDQKRAKIYTFDPAAESITLVEVQGTQALPDVGKTLSIPIDGELKKKRNSVTKGFPLELTAYTLYAPKGEKDISLLDAIRFWLLSTGIGENHIQKEEISLPADEQELDAKIGGLLTDSQLEDDKKAITIVNGTTISGLGGRMEKMLTRTGASIVSVTTSHTQIPQSKIIYYGEKSYTVNRLTKILPFTLQQRDGASISDIIIEIGEDSQRTTIF
jgi:hypothetical protein